LDGEAWKAASYGVWAPLFNDGCFYKFVFETRTDLHDKVAKSGDQTDQYYESEGSTHLFGLHIFRKKGDDMTGGDFFYQVWGPTLEVCPRPLRQLREERQPPLNVPMRAQPQSASPHAEPQPSVPKASSPAPQSAGAEGVAGVSASNARTAAANNDLTAFEESTGAGQYAEALFKAVKTGMGIQ
jgi:hypothetical protein